MFKNFTLSLAPGLCDRRRSNEGRHDNNYLIWDPFVYRSRVVSTGSRGTVLEKGAGEMLVYCLETRLSCGKAGLPVGLDLLVYTLEEWTRMISRRTRFARMLRSETVWVYRKTGELLPGVR